MTVRHLNRSFAGGEVAPEMFGRVDDIRAQSGAQLLQNLLVMPRGPAKKRPGFEFVREVKDSTRTTRLLPFKFSQDQTMVIEMGRATVATRDIGYFRFHTDGGTQLYTTPDEHVETDPASSVDTANNRIGIAVGHDFQTGDPVVLTMDAQQAVSFSAGSPGSVNWFTHPLVVGDQVCFQQTTMPANLVADRIYYVSETFTNAFRIAASRGGASLAIDDVGTGTPVVGALPSSPSFIDYGKVFYAGRFSSTSIELYLTKADAVAGTNRVVIDGPGTIDVGNPATVRVHYAYRTGDLARDSGLLSNFYCVKQPWGPELPPDVSASDHADTPPGGDLFPEDLYWYTLPDTPDQIYEVPHFYAEDTLFEVGHFQSADVLTLTHPDRPATELRRLAAERWTLEEVKFNEAIDAPSELVVTGFDGAGLEVVSYTDDTPSVITLRNLGQEAAPEFITGDKIKATGLTNLDASTFPIADYYEIRDTSIAAGALTITLRQIESGVDVGASAPASPIGARIRGVLLDQKFEGGFVYVVTAVDADGNESVASNEESDTTDLSVIGAYNRLTWDEVPGAQRYRCYKREEGIFGVIGESEQASFKDQNIAPDLSRTPPILDTSLRKYAEVTFDITNDRVQWTDHGLSDGMPVKFNSDDDLPTGISPEITYYVVNSDEDTFQVAATIGGAAILLSGTPPAAANYFATSGNFPSAGTYFEQRRVFGGGHVQPEDIWFTSSGTEDDLSYSIPTVDDDRIYHRIPGRERSEIRHLAPMSHLLMLTDASEVRISPLGDDVLTPTSFSARAQSYVGASRIPPALINNVVVFVSNRGGHVRELGLSQDVLGYLTGDLSIRATHLFDGLDISDLAYQKAPVPIVWCVSTSGQLLGFTYAPEEAIGGWHRHVTDGTFESVAVVAEGAEDRVYVIVQRTIDGNSVRYVERMHVQDVGPIADAFYVDSGLTATSPGATITGLDHLEGEAVDILSDGFVQAQQTVASGTITTPAGSPTTVHVGLPYTAQLQTLPLALQIEAFSYGREKSVRRVGIRVVESGEFSLGTALADVVPSGQVTAGSLLSGQVPVLIPSGWDQDGHVFVTQSTPLPLTVVALALEVAVGG